MVKLAVIAAGCTFGVLLFTAALSNAACDIAKMIDFGAE